jgi:RimJ/RimL family protein N-acetyltransferase
MSEQTITPENDGIINLHKQPDLQEIQVREGVTLKPMEDVDAPAIIAALDADSSIRDHVTVAGRMITMEDVKQEVANYKTDEGLIRYAIIEAGTCVGLASLWRDDGFMTSQVKPYAFGFGYFLHPAARGRGLVTDSIDSLMKTAQESFRVDSFIARCEDDNVESIAVLQNLGLEPTQTTYREPINGWTERLYERKVASGEK